jgi:hypothetical protein
MVMSGELCLGEAVSYSAKVGSRRCGRLVGPLADGGAEQVPDAVSKGQSECSADDNSQHRAADVAAADAGAQGTG